MQLRKHNWKLVRKRVPCHLCGSGEHAANACHRFTKKGRTRPDTTPRWHWFVEMRSETTCTCFPLAQQTRTAAT